MSNISSNRKKPVISPSLTIYRPELVTMMSIMGRATGIILSLGLFVWVLIVKLNPLLMSQYGYYFIVYEIFKGSISIVLINGVILFVLIGFYYHLLFALRNIVWFLWEDRLGMDLESIYKVGYLLIGISVLLATLNWLYLSLIN